MSQRLDGIEARLASLEGKSLGHCMCLVCHRVVHVGIDGSAVESRDPWGGYVHNACRPGTEYDQRKKPGGNPSAASK